MQAQRLGRVIRELRLRADLSVEQLGARAGTTGGSISRIESGKVKSPNFDLLTRIAGALGFKSVDAMLGADRGESPTTEPPPRAIAAPTPLGEILGPEGQPLKPVDLGGGIIGWIPADVDPATIPPTTIEEFRRVMREELRKVLEEERAAMSERQARNADIGEAK